MTLEDEIRHAAQAIVSAFRENQEGPYFASFAEDCSFAFHTDTTALTDREAWRDAWRELRGSGWAVEDCRTTWDHVQAIGDGGVYLHELTTTAGTADDMQTYRERETIVFERRDGALVAVHEHLSPIPDEPGTASGTASASASDAA